MSDSKDNSVTSDRRPDAPPIEYRPGPVGAAAVAELFSLAAPTILQTVSYTVMQFIDTWMLSRIGTNAATAAANSGLMSFSLICFGMGAVWVVNTLASQAFGRRQFDECGTFLWQGIWFGLIYGVVLFPIAQVAGRMFGAMGHPPELAAMEALYFRIVLSATAIKLISTACGQFLLATDRPRALVVAATSGVILNAAAAWVVVLGHGMRSRGVAGAAWAQNAGVTLEMLILIGVAMRPRFRTLYNALDWRPCWKQMALLLRIGLPSGLQFVADIFAWSLFCNLVMGQLGPAAMAANTFMLRYMVMSFLPASGMSSAVTALVGRYIGMGQPLVAAKRTHLAFGLTAVYMLGCGAVFYFGRGPLIRVFSDDPEVIAAGAVFMTYSAIYQLFDAMYIIYSGGLRGAGDTLVPALVTASLCWSLVVGVAWWVVRHLPAWGVGGPWLIATGYGIILGIFMMTRFVRGRWMGIRLEAEG